MKSQPKMLVPAILSFVVVAGIATSFATQAQSAATLDSKSVKSLTADRVWQQKAKNGPGLNYWSWKSDGSVCVRTDSNSGKCADTGRWKLDGDRVCFDMEWGGLIHGGKSACLRISNKEQGSYKALSDSGFEIFDFSVVN